jgi:hypothetical protein
MTLPPDGSTDLRSEEFVRLAEELEAALACDDLERASKANDALRKHLGSLDGAVQLVELDRACARRRGVR